MTIEYSFQISCLPKILERKISGILKGKIAQKTIDKRKLAEKAFV